VLVCVAGVALLLLAKNGLSGFAGWTGLGFFVAAVMAARVSAGKRSLGKAVASNSRERAATGVTH
jgi:hypothetical protein